MQVWGFSDLLKSILCTETLGITGKSVHSIEHKNTYLIHPGMPLDEVLRALPENSACYLYPSSYMCNDALALKKRQVLYGVKGSEVSSREKYLVVPLEEAVIWQEFSGHFFTLPRQAVVHT